MLAYQVRFLPPAKIETTRVSNKVHSLFIRLTFPKLQKPVHISQRTSWFSACFCSSENDYEPIWSSLRTTQQSIPAPLNRKVGWFSVQPSQKPANGDIWLQISGNRVLLMVILCGPSSLNQRRNSINLDDDKDSLKSLSVSDLRDSVNYSENFPTLYYMWDSGNLSKIIDLVKSSILIMDDSICLMLSPAGKNENWSESDLRIVQKGGNISNSIPEQKPPEKKNFHWQGCVEGMEKESLKGFIEAKCVQKAKFHPRNPNIADADLVHGTAKALNGDNEAKVNFILPREYQGREDFERKKTRLNTWVDKTVAESSVGSTQAFELHRQPPMTKTGTSKPSEVGVQRLKSLMLAFVSPQTSSKLTNPSKLQYISQDWISNQIICRRP